MGARGRGGSFRGRGSRGRGRGGRGKSFGRFGPSRRFDTGRLQDEDEESDASSDDEDADDVDIDSELDEEDEDDEATAKRPYMSLLQSFSEDKADLKRRKLNQDQKPTSADSGNASDHDTGGEDKELDLVEEEDEGEDEDEQVEGGLEEDSEDEETTDPFDVHFAHPDELTSAAAVGQAKTGNWSTKRMIMNTLRATVQSPGNDTEFKTPTIISGVDELKLKSKLLEGTGNKLSKLDAPQKAFASLIFDYNDVLFSERTPKNSKQLRQITCLHVLNHIFKTRDRVIKNNYKLAKDGVDSELELRDQGFTRPKVLFLLPTRNSCAKMIATIRELCNPDQEENRKRFDESYITKDTSFTGDRPEDFRDLFEGNDDDMFRVGVKFTRKTVKYFAQFYNSDILFASPLGLRMAIGSEEDKKKPDYDFLSSIEMVVVDQADALLMQNWEHVEYIFEHLNLQPKDAHGCDFSRVRNWYLEDWAKYFRQTIITSAFNTPELVELQRLHCQNWAGKVRLQSEYPGRLQQLGIKSKQTFSRFQASSVEKEPDARFEYFVSAIVPYLVKRSKDVNGTLLFIPSYLDFVRVRNYFATALEVSSVPFGAISEYTDVPEASRARSHFLNGRHKILLYSERAHHFRRYQFKGVQRVIFYGLPDNPIFYKEIAGDSLAKSEQDMIIEPGRGTVRVMFSKYDAMKLERIAGSKRVGKMIQDRGDTFDFV